MPWVRPTLDEIIVRVENDITSRMTGNAPLMRRALLKILSRVWAGLNHILYGLIVNESKNILVSTATGEALRAHGRERGITPTPSVPASGDIRITGSNGVSIPSGTIYVADTGLEYVTTGAGVIASGFVLVEIECRISGVAGNIPVDSELIIQTPISGADDTAIAEEEIGGGVDEESDESLRARIIQDIQNPAAGGSKADFVRWAKSVSGVGNAWPFASYYGAGTVAVVIRSDDVLNPAPDGAVVTACQAYIDRDDIRPITMDVTVSPVVEKLVEFDLTITPDTVNARTAIEANLKDLLQNGVEPGGVLYLSHIRKAISLGGVLDYSIDVITIAGASVPIANYDFAGFDYPLFDSINW